MRRDHVDKRTQLLLRAQGGDPQAFAELYAALSPVVRGFIFFLVGQLCPHECEDLVHEAFLVVWERLATYRGEASATTFVLAIAKNVALKDMSKRHRLPVAYAGDLSYVPTRETSGQSELDSDEIAPVIEKAMAQLTEAQQQAVQLAIVRGLPRSEALKLAECSPNQFANRLRRAAITLRRLLSDLRCVWL
ncbi:MAG TPA: RNA polymerase sigma factor [Phycisphaerae bacterium]|nr:RNA polymerase sigma factor [Phycisphaerae bacterium]